VEGSLVNILSSQIDLGKFFGSEVSVFVHGDSEGLVGTGIVLVNEVQVALARCRFPPRSHLCRY